MKKDYLLTWNPKFWKWGKYHDVLENIKKEKIMVFLKVTCIKCMHIQKNIKRQMFGYFIR